MKDRCLVVGSGVAAGLAACLLSRRFAVTLAARDDARASPIPETVPRALLVDALGIAASEEDAFLAAIAPRARTVAWRFGALAGSRPLASTAEYVVFDKGALWRALAARAGAARAPAIDAPCLSAAPQTLGFDRIVDARGRAAVAADPDYALAQVAPAATRCTYAIARRPDDVDPARLAFFSEREPGPGQRVLFVAPVAPDVISVGCSHAPGDVLSRAWLMREAASALGVRLSPEAILMEGEALPDIVEADCDDPRVAPVGEARRAGCPLSDYGVANALDHIRGLLGRREACAPRRPLTGLVDPHVPVELIHA